MTPFPIDFFPDPINQYIREGAAAIPCDPSYIGVPLIPALASAIGNTRRIRLKSDWTEPAVIWGAIITDSGKAKSPAMELATQPVWRRQRKLLRDHAASRAKYDAAKKAWKATPKDSREDEPEPPTPLEHPVCVDTTIEALADRLLATPRGTLLAVDELAGWFGSFARYKSSTDVPHWLSMFGARALKVDRKNLDRPTIYIPHAAVCVAGTIQPATLRRCLTDDLMDNGLAARLLLAMPPTSPKRWTDREIDPATARAVDDVFDHLYDLRAAPGPDGEDEPVAVDLTDDARARFASFVDEHGAETAGLEGPLAAVWSKLEGYGARFALVRHCCRKAAGEQCGDFIDGEDIAAGIGLADWFGAEAKRIYGAMGESTEERQRRELLEWIAGKGGRVTVRDLQLGPARYRRDPGLAESDLEELADAAYGAWEYARTSERGGHPARYFVMEEHPDFPSHSTSGVDTTTDSITPAGVVSLSHVSGGINNRSHDGWNGGGK